MGKEYTKQHIVPSCYIANFGANGNEGRKSSIYYYLKEKGISGCGCAGDFPVEGNYYDIPELGENKKILELLFQKIETDLSDLLKELICSITFEKKDRKGCYVDYPLSKRQALSAQFAMQIQRTNLLRKQFEYIYDQLKAHVPCGSIPDYDKSDYKRLQNTQILSFDLAHFYANIFNDKKWVIIVNHTELPFLTSDNPLIAVNHGKNVHVSAASDDLTYYIPISPLFAIEMYPKSVKWNDLFCFDEYDVKNIALYNMYIERECTRMLFSNKDFGFIKELLDKELS
ncbi:DUF4238 domain-containing protein [Ruminococcus flavefaciens]|uniref:Uncharacterized protein DUF4238 n=1 Tax=Ruminococcus flavefaciens TaxID=1265 RepID=A0A315XXK4_RUMFL|nr:DUF4238 domain-containing protein [Ruminococcus flavefaciens]PWJ12241.1 uncharacterized protein DUF4238 [Ruminococcus flavefaciens]SSA49731.1 Protein of unknown function [Ruminococcus flavefaciens]